MRAVRFRVGLATAYLSLVVGLLLGVGEVALAQTPAADQYGTKTKGVSVVEAAQQPATLAQGGEAGLPNTGLSLLGTVAAGGALVAVGLALRRRERSGHHVDGG